MQGLVETDERSRDAQHDWFRSVEGDDCRDILTISDHSRLHRCNLPIARYCEEHSWNRWVISEFGFVISRNLESWIFDIERERAP